MMISIVLILSLLLPGGLSGIVNKSVIRKYMSLNPNKMIQDLGVHLAVDTSDCGRDMNTYINNIEEGEEWAISMIDATAKLQPGILKGNVYELGSYDECMEIDANVVASNDTNPLNIKGKYCFGSIPVPDDFILSRRLGIKPEGLYLKMKWAICIPHRCNADKLNEYFRVALNSSNLTLTFDDSECKIKDDPVLRLTTLDIFTICLAVLLFLLLFAGTVYDEVLKKRNLEGNCQSLLVFSVTKNLRDLFFIKKIEENSKTLNSLIGLRALSMAMIVYAHTMFVGALYPIQNYIDGEQFARSFFGQHVIGSSITVDTFLVMSGALASYNFLNQFKNRMQLRHLPAIYIHRYVRLTPALAAVVLFQVTLFKYCGSGPLWTTALGKYSGKCERHWWSTLLYVQNYLNPHDICVGQTWYLSVDTQLYFLAPFFMLLFQKFRKLMYPVLVTFAFLSAACTYGSSYYYKIQASMADGEEDILRMRESLIYVPTHARAAPWFLGMALGFFLYENQARKLALKPIVYVTGWVICTAILLTVPFGYYPFNKRHHVFHPIDDPFYLAFHRFGWALAVIWIIVACENGYGGVVYSILSFRLLQPLSRLSYSQYLVHMFVQVSINASRRAPLYFRYFFVFPYFVGEYVISVIFAVVLSLTFESPLVRLEKIYQKSGKKSTESNNEKGFPEKVDKREKYDSNIVNFGHVSEKQMEVTKF